MADAAILRWPEGKVRQGNEKLSDWAYDRVLKWNEPTTLASDALSGKN